MNLVACIPPFCVTQSERIDNLNCLLALCNKELDPVYGEIRNVVIPQHLQHFAMIDVIE